MSLRRELYELLENMPDGNAVTRIAVTGAFLDGLPPAEAEVAERRLLALTEVYAATLENGLKGTVDEFFAAVDIEDNRLKN